MEIKKCENYSDLTEAEKKIYNSIMRNFPATDPESAFNKAINGGVNYQFINK